MYNENIKKYNEYKEESIEAFIPIHKEYIDYNNNGVYEGRELNEETNS